MEDLPVNSFAEPRVSEIPDEDNLEMHYGVSDIYVQDVSLARLAKQTRRLLSRSLELEALRLRLDKMRSRLPKIRNNVNKFEVLQEEQERLDVLQEQCDRRKQLIVERSEQLHLKHQEQKNLLNEMLTTQEQIEQERKHLADLEWELDLRRYKKCNQISKIFSFDEVELQNSTKGFSIRHIWIPKHTPTIISHMTDDSNTEKYISTALGHICLLVTLLSKYLNVSLLHEMKFIASTSEVHDNMNDLGNARRANAHIFKLCHGPNTELMRLRRALGMLIENILQLCRTRGVTLDSDKTLKSLQPLYLLLAKEALV